MEPAISAGKSDVRSLTRRFLPLVVVALIVALAVPALARHGSAETTIIAFDFDFEVPNENPLDPRENSVTIEQGTNVFFENIGPNAPHTFSSLGAFESGAVLPGGDRIVQTEHLRPGTYQFFCGFHPVLMTGELTVVAAP